MLDYMQTVGTQVTVMFLLMALGYLLYKIRMVDDRGAAQMSSLLLKIVMPAAIISSYQREFDAELAKLLLLSLALGAVCHLLPMALSPLLFKRRDPSYKAASLSLIFTNCGCVGIPLLDSLLGATGVFLGSGFIVVTVALIWTYGIFVLSGDKKSLSVKKLVFNPGVVAVAVGMAVFLSPVKLPELLYLPVKAVAAMNTPLAMVVLGVYIAQTKPLSCFTSRKVHIVWVFRLLLIPAAVLGGLCLIPMDSGARMALLIGVASPSSMAIPMLAQAYGEDYLLASKCVVATTLFSVVTIPLLLTIAAAVFI